MAVAASACVAVSVVQCDLVLYVCFRLDVCASTGMASCGAAGNRIWNGHLVVAGWFASGGAGHDWMSAVASRTLSAFALLPESGAVIRCLFLIPFLVVLVCQCSAVC